MCGLIKIFFRFPNFVEGLLPKLVKRSQLLVVDNARLLLALRLRILKEEAMVICRVWF